MTQKGLPAIHWNWTRGDFPTAGKHPFWPLTAALAAMAIWWVPTGAASDAPQITGASVIPKRFTVRDGTTFRYQLSKKADVFFFFDRGVKGRLVGGRCHRLSRRNRHHKPCAFYVRSGSFKQAGVAGPNTRPFSGRIGRRTLLPAHYKVTLVAVDAMGSPSTPGTVLRFTVLRG